MGEKYGLNPLLKMEVFFILPLKNDHANLNQIMD